jgi:hypothetical protein
LACTSCGREFHEECESNCYDCHEHVLDVAVEKLTGRRQREGPYKSDDEVTDITSTGRKRAAKMYGSLMDKTQPCEWRGKKNVGGGIPTMGCVNGFRQDIHHGPDKTTTNNARENIHLICKKCVGPDTRILTENLEWVTAKSLRIGDRLVGFSEGFIPHKRNSPQGYGARKTKFEVAIVEANDLVIKPSYKFTMKNGATLISSYDHQWVSSKYGDSHLLWRTSDKITAFDSISYLVDPWDIDESWLSGWLAGFLDGEGALSGYHLSVAQKQSSISDLAKSFISDLITGKLHYNLRGRKHLHHHNIDVYRVTNLPDILTILGTVRPIRLLESFPEFLWGKYPFMGPISKKVGVAKVEFIGEQELSSIQTSSRTFIAEGFYSHNCHKRWHYTNDAVYDKDKYRETKHEPVDATSKELYDYELKWLRTPRGDFKVKEDEDE